jgi:polar amino acid transport system ATP-binding protein
VNHLEKIDGGEIRVHGKLVGYRETPHGLVEESDAVVSRNRRDIGMVFQSFNLFPHMTAMANVMSGPVRVRRLKREVAADRASALLTRMGLGGKLQSYPSQLSGGQQQRVAIARALAMQPSLMLFDEPTSALDPEMIGEVLEVIAELAREGMTMIIVTHEMGFVREVASRVVMMDEGQIVEEAPPDRFFSAPTQLRTRAFLSKIR